jgi:hypothetical protein
MVCILSSSAGLPEILCRYASKKRFFDRVCFFINSTVDLPVALQFETISHFLSPREPPPSMVLDRTDEEELLTLPSPKTRCQCALYFILEAFY